MLVSSGVVAGALPRIGAGSSAAAAASSSVVAASAASEEDAWWPPPTGTAVAVGADRPSTASAPSA